MSSADLIVHARDKFQADQAVIYIAHEDKTGLLAGIVMLNRAKQRPEDINLAYYTSPERRGQGIAPRMIDGLLAALFAKTKLEKVFCAIWGTNKASLRTLEKTGFEYLGYLPSYIDAPPVLDHQFIMTRETFCATPRHPTHIILASEKPAS